MKNEDDIPTTIGDRNSNDVANENSELIRLCRTGRLYDIEKWIADGKSLEVRAARRGRQKSLLQIAVDTGFHSLVELIAKNETRQESKNAALADAVSLRRMALIELLVANGGDIKSVPFIDVLLTWEPNMIRFFLERGSDPVEGRPFAEAFRSKIRTALRAYLDCKRAHPELAVQLQEQLDCALRYFCGEGDLKWVSLLMWAGGDPRSPGPCLGKDYTDDPECYVSGLEQACYPENADVLKKLKPDPSRDNLSELLKHAVGRRATMQYLLEIGANPNDKPNGGSSALDSALWWLNFAGFDPYRRNSLKSKYQLSKAFDCIGELLAHHAVWNPNEQSQINSLRRILLECEPDVTIELLKLFRSHNACPAEHVHKLLGTPRMKEHLKAESNALLRLGIHLDAGQKRWSAQTA